MPPNLNQRRINPIDRSSTHQSNHFHNYTLSLTLTLKKKNSHKK
jgi:hypothetical protein